MTTIETAPPRPLALDLDDFAPEIVCAAMWHLRARRAYRNPSYLDTIMRSAQALGFTFDEFAAFAGVDDRAGWTKLLRLWFLPAQWRPPLPGWEIVMLAIRAYGYELPAPEAMK